MNRRGFFKALAATAFIATASTTRLGKYVVEVEEDYAAIGAAYAEALARSLIETKETVAANVLNNCFSSLGGDGVALISAAHPHARVPWRCLWANFFTQPRLSDGSIETVEIWIDDPEDMQGKKIPLLPTQTKIPHTYVNPSDGSVRTINLWVDKEDERHV